LARLGIEEISSGVCTGTNWFKTKGDTTVSVSPIDDKPIASVVNGSAEDLETVIQTAEKAFQDFRDGENLPGRPGRGSGDD
jgi:aldehyde dehydrogenase (NAD+)